MREDLISKDELIDDGWPNRQVDAALDAPDAVGPCGHWLNPHGKPFYNRERVAVAAYRMGLSDEAPPESHWAWWKNSLQPTCLPQLTFDFHRLANAYLPGSSHEFWSLRLSHPVAGRQPGTDSQESVLIERALIAIVSVTLGRVLDNWQALTDFLAERLAEASRAFGQCWPESVLIRPAYRSSYLSRATGKRSVQRFLNVLALTHAGLMRDANGEALELLQLLIGTPRFRIDPSAIR